MKSLKILQKIFTKQHSEFTCGIACLAMLVKYYEGNVRQEDLRTITGTTIQGTTLLGLYQAAEKLNFTPNAYEADIDSLKSITVPAILHVVKNQRMEHYVVCFGFDGNKFIIGDPGDKIAYMTEPELEEIWKSKALLMLEPTPEFVKKDSERKEKYDWLRNIIKEDYPILTVSFFLGLIIAALGLSTAIFSQKLIDDLLPSKNQEKLILGIVLFFILLISRSGLDYLRSIFMLRQMRGLNNRLIDGFFSKILYLPKSFFDSTKTGEIIARMNDSRRIQQTLSYIVGGVLIEILVLFFAIAYLFFYSWKMALIASACIPFFIVLVIAYNKKIVAGQRNVMVSYAATEGLLIDFIQGVNDIKLANKQPVFKQSIQMMYGIFQELGYKLGMLGNQYGFIAQIISTITSVSLIVLGVSWILSGQLKLGELMAIITIGNMIVSSSASLSGVNIRLQEAGVAFERFFEFVKAKPEFDPEENLLNSKKDTEDAHLQIKQLSFRFIGRKKLFENVSIEVNKGEIVTLFGEVGSGKSTLIQLLQKHYSPESGEILFNGKPMSEYSTPLWREYVGVVSQHTKIFNGNVGENICLGNFFEERKSVMKFCEDYGFSSFFYNFPQGLDTLLGEDGINISGGQQQLIALARALYRSPSLLLLDEPTSAMDTKTEQFIIHLLQQRVNQFAILMVTHRMYLAQISNRIYHLENGSLTNPL
ncbi:MAG: Lactococcin-G-processing and transport ATP-binding protein LagD [Candidatus Ordinivivax streblomastigis]|uniref:Lactococcin-G-processing and transport ATP-binding protein LagD n=1 Tax=Candidatus Ordinivivax streblomastigis TaxID=2540710 RepID=A0A5M8P5F9_9BACT|nr:MAG: Lactococcin-G-processing and transport ATP-binding protein LagD [Candidatus Ordinivivax streblomastigis]